MEEKSSGNNIFEYLEIINRRKWLLIVPTIVGTIIAAVIAVGRPSYYRSSTMIMIEGQQIPEAYVKSTDQTPLASRLSTLSQQIMSRTRLEKIASEFNLYRQSSQGGLLSRISPGSGSGGISTEALIEQMRRDIEVKVIAGGAIRRAGQKDADAFSISYISQDPVTAMRVTNTLASLFIEENLKIREEYAEGTSEFLESELDKAKEELERQERTLKDFKERHMGALPEQLDANLRTLDRLQLELQNLTSEIRSTEEKRNLLEEQLGLGPDGSVNPGSDLEKELQEMKKELLRLRSLYKENYPDVIMTKNRITELEARLEVIRNTDASSLKTEEINPAVTNPAVYNDFAATKSKLATLRQRENDIRRQIRLYERRVEVTPTNEQRLADIKRDYDISLQNYRSLLEKKLNAKLAENLEKRQKGERFRIIDPAYLPQRPFMPDRRMITLQGSAAGLAFGGAIVFLLEFLNPAFRKPEDFVDVLQIPVLSAIPGFSSEGNDGSGRKFFLVKGKKEEKRA